MSHIYLMSSPFLIMCFLIESHKMLTIRKKGGTLAKVVCDVDMSHYTCPRWLFNTHLEQMPRISSWNEPVWYATNSAFLLHIRIGFCFFQVKCWDLSSIKQRFLSKFPLSRGEKDTVSSNSLFSSEAYHT